MDDEKNLNPIKNKTIGEKIMSKEMWVLTIRTSLPELAHSKEDVKMTNFVFQSFETAKKVLREKLREYAFSENEMFDGRGGLVNLEEYAEVLTDEFDDEQSLSLRKINELEKALLLIFEGNDVKLTIEEVKCCSDWMIAVDVAKDSIKMYGYDDGPINGYDPHIATNMFDMTEEKDYYLYIDDMFGQDVSSELYIDLKKVEVK